MEIKSAPTRSEYFALTGGRIFSLFLSRRAPRTTYISKKVHFLTFILCCTLARSLFAAGQMFSAISFLAPPILSRLSSSPCIRERTREARANDRPRAFPSANYSKPVLSTSFMLSYKKPARSLARPPHSLMRAARAEYIFHASV